MEYNNISDYEKVLLDRVTKVPVGDRTFFVRIAGPLNFNIMAAMSNKDISREERAIQVLCACLCDSEGIGLFDATNEKHLKLIKEFEYPEVTALMTVIWTYFDKKKVSSEVK